MFTGIVEATGKVMAVQRRAAGLRLAIDVSSLGAPPPIGSSLAVAGACLTVAGVAGSVAEFDVVGETCRRTNLADLQVGQEVNLERPLRVGAAVDGHFVQGHVDATARVESVIQADGQWTVWFAADEPEAVGPYLVPKGSVAVEGVSLTVVDAEPDRFSVVLIPTTLARTTLGRVRLGQRVNVETDLLVRTVVHRLRNAGQPGAGLTIEALAKAGFA
jgi:riboflavin synthase alpha subunit